MIIFFGSSEYSIPVAKSLSKAGLKLTIVTTPDRPVGRKQLLAPNPLGRFAQNNHRPVFKLENLEKNRMPSKLIAQIKRADLGVCCVYGKIIPPWLIDRFGKGILNIHPSLLPKYRGASPAVGMILNEEKVGGVTIVKMDEKVDHGPVVTQAKSKIRRNDTSRSLYKRFFDLAAKITPKTVDAYLNLTLPPRAQNHRLASLTPRLTRDDGYVKRELLEKGLRGKAVPFKNLPPIFQKIITHPKEKYSAAQAVFNLHRTLFPWPGLWTNIAVGKEKKRLKIIKVKTERKKLKLLQVQLEGRRPVSFEEFAKTYSYFSQQ